MPWNDENVVRLKELWDQGLPTAQIGKLLGFTKNAVVGKAHRIGLERRPSPIRRTAAKPDRKKARSPVMPKLNFGNIVCICNKVVLKVQFWHHRRASFFSVRFYGRSSNRWRSTFKSNSVRLANNGIFSKVQQFSNLSCRKTLVP